MEHVPFKRKWSEAQKEACVAAILEHGYSARLTAECAHRGELPGKGRDLEPFPVPAGTVADWGKDARRLAAQVTRAAAQPADRLRDGLGHLVARWEKDVDKVRRAKVAVKPERIAALAKTGRELEMMARGLHRSGNGATRPAEEDGKQDRETGRDDFVSQLAEQEGKNGRRGRSLSARSTPS